jgi:hypothetical protein
MKPGMCPRPKGILQDVPKHFPNKKLPSMNIITNTINQASTKKD